MTSILSAEQAALLESGEASIVVASCNERGAPSLGWGLGCRVSDDLARIVVFLLEAQSHEVLVDVRAPRPVSVLFTLISARSIQLKGSRAREVPLRATDSARLDRYGAELTNAWQLAGHPESWGRALTNREADALVAIELELEQAFDQTPGPRAGSPLGADS